MLVWKSEKLRSVFLLAGIKEISTGNEAQKEKGNAVGWLEK